MKELKAPDLRVGNLVLDSTKNTTRVESISIGEHHRIRYGIPITSDRLINFGFVKTKVPMKIDIEYIDYRMGQFVLFILPKGIVEVEFCAAHNTIEERGYLCAIKYVHQLQNIYYALTGKELIF